MQYVWKTSIFSTLKGATDVISSEDAFIEWFFLFTMVPFNPISAGVLENQDMLGGGQFDPPPQFPCLMSKYNK